MVVQRKYASSGMGSIRLDQGILAATRQRRHAHSVKPGPIRGVRVFGLHMFANIPILFYYSPQVTMAYMCERILTS